MTDAPTPTPRPPALVRARLPYPPAVQEAFGISPVMWRALVDACYPSAKTSEAVELALSYCAARKLDPFKRPINIVPVWSKEQNRLIETVWQGIGELRATAIRTRRYAGCDETEEGPLLDDVLDGTKIKYPEWARVTLYRINDRGRRERFVGPKVYWKESYARASRNTVAPNEMWSRRPRGQLEKVAEAAALRRAFPEEVGDVYAAEEMAGQIISDAVLVEHGAVRAAPQRAPALTASFSDEPVQAPPETADEAIPIEPEVSEPAPEPDPEFDVLGWAGELQQRLAEYDDVEALRATWDTHKGELQQRYPGAFRELNRAVVERALAIPKAEAAP